MDERRERELVLDAIQSAFILDKTKGNIIVYVGPHKTSLSGTDEPVVFESDSRSFKSSTIEKAVSQFVSADEGSYVVLENPAERDDPADRPWRRNQELAGRIPAGWQKGRTDREATLALLHTLRKGMEDDACDKAVELLNSGAGAQSIWDALFLGSAELVVRQPGIVALHAATTTNAFHYCYQAAGDDAIRRLILLQNAAFLPMFRQAMAGRGNVGEFVIDEWEPAEGGNVQGIFEAIHRDSMKAARMTLAYFEDRGAVRPWVEESRRLVVQKGSSVHDYKFAMAAIEDAEKISPEWLGRYLAASTFLLQGSGKGDNPLIQKAAAILKDST